MNADSTSSGSSSQSSIGARKLFCAGALGTLLAYGAFWIGQFSVIRDWCETNGLIASAGALGFFVVFAATAGWIAADARPRRIHGAISIGLGLPGAIMAVNAARSDSPPVTNPETVTASMPMTLATDGGVFAFLRPVVTPISIVRSYNEQLVEKQLVEHDSQLEQLQQVLAERETALGEADALVRVLQEEVSLKTESLQFMTAQFEGIQNQLEAFTANDNTAELQNDLRLCLIEASDLTESMAGLSAELRRREEHLERQAGEIRSLGSQLTRALEELVRVGAIVQWDDRTTDRNRGRLRATLAMARASALQILQRLSQDDDRRLSQFATAELESLRRIAPVRPESLGDNPLVDPGRD